MIIPKVDHKPVRVTIKLLKSVFFSSKNMTNKQLQTQLVCRYRTLMLILSFYIPTLVHSTKRN
jgi:hypothetical protein